MSVVTIRGQLGSGAPEIAKLVADKIGGDYVDRHIIAQVAERLNRESAEVRAKEQPPGTLLGRIAEALTRSSPFDAGLGIEGAYLPSWELPVDDESYVRALKAVITALAQSPNIVIYGRGSQFILKDHPRAFHVLVVAPLDIRTKRVMAELGADERAARGEIDRIDGSSRAYIKRYFGGGLEDPIHYDLVVNTKRLSFEAAANIVGAGLDSRKTP